MESAEILQKLDELQKQVEFLTEVTKRNFEYSSAIVSKSDEVLTRIFEMTPCHVVDLKETLWDWRDGFRGSEIRWAAIEKANRMIKSRRVSFMIDDEHMMCRILGRYWIVFRTGDGLLTNRLMTEALWELSVTEVITHEVKRGMTVVDIGANVGYFSLIMGDMIGPSGKLYMAEPIPRLHSSLKRSIELNYLDDRSVLIPNAMFSSSGKELRFFIPEDTKNARLELESINAEKGDELVLVTKTLDDVIPHGQSVGVIKVDAEGAEFEIWKGMERVIRESPELTVILEFNTNRPYSPDDFLRKIVSDGFNLRYIDDFEGVKEIEVNRLLNENRGKDWMLYLKKH